MIDTFPTNYPELPVKERISSTYELTEEDKAYLKSFAKDGIIPFDDYISAMNKILNRN